MTGLSASGESTVLSALLAARYISLHTADPGPTGVNEVSGNAYARIGPMSFTAAGSNPTSYSNTALTEFPIATGLWGTVTHFGVWSAASGGTFLGSGALNTSKLVDVDDLARFPIGSLIITAD